MPEARYRVTPKLGQGWRLRLFEEEDLIFSSFAQKPKARGQRPKPGDGKHSHPGEPDPADGFDFHVALDLPVELTHHGDEPQQDQNKSRDGQDELS